MRKNAGPRKYLTHEKNYQSHDIPTKKYFGTRIYSRRHSGNSPTMARGPRNLAHSFYSCMLKFQEITLMTTTSMQSLMIRKKLREQLSKTFQIVIDRFHVNYDFKYSRMSFQQFFESRGLGGMCIRGGLFKGGALLEFRNLIGALIWFRHVQYINNIQFDFAGL